MEVKALPNRKLENVLLFMISHWKDTIATRSARIMGYTIPRHYLYSYLFPFFSLPTLSVA